MPTGMRDGPRPGELKGTPSPLATQAGQACELPVWPEGLKVLSSPASGGWHSGPDAPSEA